MFLNVIKLTFRIDCSIILTTRIEIPILGLRQCFTLNPEDRFVVYSQPQYKIIEKIKPLR